MAKTLTLQGIIETQNDRGLKIGGQWVNWSKFGEGPDPFLTEGMEVLVNYSDTGWIKSIVTDPKPAYFPRPSLADAERANGVIFQRELPEAPASKVTQAELIARQSMLKASCMFWQGQQVTTQIICDFADELVKHVLRGV